MGNLGLESNWQRIDQGGGALASLPCRLVLHAPKPGACERFTLDHARSRPNHALLGGVNTQRWHPLSIESTFSVIMWHPFGMGGDHCDLL